MGSQESIREIYISTGSLYLCTAGMLELGLPPEDPFWTEPASAWTQKRIWAGDAVAPDHAIGKDRPRLFPDLTRALDLVLVSG